MTRPNKRQRTGREEEVTFDYDARQEYLTGFRKRKQQRIKDRQDVNARKERAHKIEERKQLREQRRKEVEEHVEHVNSVLKRLDEKEKQNGYESEESSFEGFGDSEQPTPLPQEQEYIDEDLYTTVTVEPMDGSDEEVSNREDVANIDESPKHKPARKSDLKTSSTKPGTVRSGNTKKKKKKSFRYETKAERKVTKRKERSRGIAAKGARKSAK